MKVYSFVIVLEATVKGYTIVFFFLSVYTLCTQGAFLNGVWISFHSAQLY